MQFGQQNSVDVGSMGNKNSSAAQSEPEDGGPGSEAGRQGRTRMRSEGATHQTEEGAAQQSEEGDEPEVELPPPMRPISSIPATEEAKKVTALKDFFHF